MPDKIVNLGGVNENMPRTPYVQSPLSNIPGGASSKNADDIFSQALATTKSGGQADIAASSFYQGDKFDSSRPYTDWEEGYGQQQSSSDKIANGVVKMVGTAATTFVSGTVGLINGIGASIADGRFTSLFDNYTTRHMQQVSDAMENAMPNYYTQAENDAAWYSSKNLLTANFLGDKLIKNLGFSVGALGAGAAWSGVLQSISGINKLVQAGRGMEAITATEEAMSAVPKVQKYNAFSNKIAELANSYVKPVVASAAKNSDRILTSAMGTFGEAGMEGLQNMNKFRDEAIQEYKNIHGVNPTGDALNEINHYADKVGNYTFGMNTLLLTGTNYVQLPKILGSSRKVDKALINDVEQDIVGGAWKQSVPKTAFGRFSKKAYNAAGLIFSPSEAFEEGAQNAIQVGTNDYFSQAYKNHEKAKGILAETYSTMKGVFGEGVEKTLNSKEGLESILIGGLSGGLQQSGIVGTYKNESGKTRIGIGKSGEIAERGVFGDGGEKAANTTIALARLNKMPIKDALQSAVKYMAIGIGSQQKRQQAIEQNDILSEKDYENDYALSYVMPRVLYGKEDSIHAELSGYKEQAMSPEGFQDLQNAGIANAKENSTQFIDRINALSELTNNVKDIYEKVADKYSEVRNKDGKKIYSEGAIEKMVYAAAKIKNYEDRYNSLLPNLLGINTYDALSSIIEKGTVNKEATAQALEEINNFKVNGFPVVKERKEELKADFQDLIELALRRKSFVDEYNSLKDKPSKWEEDYPHAPADVAVDVKQRNAEGKSKTVQAAVGETYNVTNEPVFRDGNTLAHKSQLTILSKTLGGELEVLLPNGRTTYMTPNELKDYQLSLDAHEDDGKMDALIDEAIDKTLPDDYKGFLPVGATIAEKIKFINSLNDKVLVDRVQREIRKNTKDYLEEKRIAAEEVRKLQEEEELKKKLIEEQKKLEEDSSTNTGDNEEDLKNTSETQDSTAPINILFTHTTASSAPTKAHQFIEREFMSNVDFLDNQNELRAVVFVQKHEKELGVEGAIDVLTEGYTGDKSDVIAVMYVNKDGKPVNAKGEVVTDPKQMALSVLPTASMTWANGKPKYRTSVPSQSDADTKKQAEEASASWLKEREKIKNNPPQVHTFRVSGGIAVKSQAKNNVLGSLLPADGSVPISTPGLVVIPTTGKIVDPVTGQTKSYPNGRPVFQYKSTTQFLQNRNFTPSESIKIFDLLKALVGEVYTNKSINGTEKSRTITRYLQNIMFWSTPKDGATPSNNQVWIDLSTYTLHIGSNQFLFTPSGIENSRKEITEAVQKIYNSVNNKTLVDNKRFFDVSVDDKGNLISTPYTNYQEYLLQGSNPLLFTNVIAPKVGEVAFEQKYAVIEGLNIPIAAAPAQPKAAAKSTEPAETKEGEYDKTNVKGKRFTINGSLYEANATDKNPRIILMDITEGKYVGDKKTLQLLPEKLNAGIKDGSIIDENIPSKTDWRFEASNIANLMNSQAFETRPELVEFVEKVLNMKITDSLKDIKEANDKYVATLTKVKTRSLQELQSELLAGKPITEFTPEEQVVLNTPEEEETPESNPDAFEVEMRFGEEEKPAAGLSSKPSIQNTGIVDDEEDTLREVSNVNVERMSAEDIKEYEKWHKENVPNLPYEILERMVTTTGGKKAWGVMVDGIAKFFIAAEKGTEYHETFHQIFKYFADGTKRSELLSAYRSKPGTFFSRELKKNIPYSEATNSQLEDKMADDFAEYRKGKLEAKSTPSAVRSFFKAILDFFNTLIRKRDVVKDFFDKIDKGGFKDSSIQNTISSVPEYRLVGGLTTEEQTHAAIEDIAGRALNRLFDNTDGLYNIPTLTDEEFFGPVKEFWSKPDKNGFSKLDIVGEEGWLDLVEATKLYLKQFNVAFEEENNSDDTNNREYVKEHFTLDVKETSPYPIKLLLSMIPQVKEEGLTSLNLPVLERSIIGGLKLLNARKAYITIMNNLVGMTSLDDMAKRLSDLAKNDPTYVRLVKRLKIDVTTGTIDYDNLSKNDIRLLTQMFVVFSKQNPTASIQYTGKDGDVYIANANLNTVAQETKRDWIEDIKNSKSVKVEADRFVITAPDMPISNFNEQIKFLKAFGIPITLKQFKTVEKANTDITKAERQKIAFAAASIKSQFEKGKNLFTLNEKTLNITGALNDIAEIYSKYNNPISESVFKGSEGKQKQQFGEHNVLSVMANKINSVNSIEELLEKEPSFNDIFTGIKVNKGIYTYNSVFLARLFDNKGKRIKTRPIVVGYADGQKNLVDDKSKSTSTLTEKRRLEQELNFNLDGKYYVLISADSSTEWDMNIGNTIDFETLSHPDVLQEDIYSIFKGYLEDEIALSKEDRNYLHNMNGKSSELRFFKEILPASLQEKVIKDGVDAHKKEFLESVNTYLSKLAAEYKAELLDKNVFVPVTDGYTFKNINSAFLKSFNMDHRKNAANFISGEEIDSIVNYVSLNSVINNIEFHKVIFGDPYQFSIKKSGAVDETKRLKSFTSPRQRYVNNNSLNNVLNRKYNVVNGVQLEPTDPGFHSFKDYIPMVVFADVESFDEIYPDKLSNEADAATWKHLETVREDKIKSGTWSDEAEAWYQYEQAVTRLAMQKHGYVYTNAKLKQADEKLVEQPEPVYFLNIDKPITSGNKYNRESKDNLLIKTSDMPFYWSMAPEGSNLQKHFIHIFKEKLAGREVGKFTVVSGVKVGAEKLRPIYNPDGSFNESPFTDIINESWDSRGVQVENVYKTGNQTTGSQMTKIATDGLFDAGEVKPEHKDLVERHDGLLRNLIENGYNKLLEKLGITEENGEFVIKDYYKAAALLEKELTKRGLSENALDTIRINPETHQFEIPFEASPKYEQIRNTLYSMIDKSISSRKVNGGTKTQAPSTLWEGGDRGMAVKTKDGYKKITKEEYEAMPNKDGVVFTSSALEMYTLEKPYCEVMMACPNRRLFNKIGLYTDEEILDYLNSAEGIKILSGVGFRIPTDGLHALENFRIVKFLPQSMGNTIIVPAAITTKVGSDFDVDKLNTYLKNLYVNTDKQVVSVPYYESKALAEEKFGEEFDKILQSKIDAHDIAQSKEDNLENTFIALISGTMSEKSEKKWSDILKDIFGEDATASDIRDELANRASVLNSKLEKLTNEQIQAEFKKAYINRMYQASLENAYFATLQEILSLPENRVRMLTPTGTGILEDLAGEIDKAKGLNPEGFITKMINKSFLANMRHAFLTGKRWVGIGAVNITGHTLTQRTPTYVDPAKFITRDQKEKTLYGNFATSLPTNKMVINGTPYHSLSGVKNVGGVEYIGDILSNFINAFVDVAKDPFILRLVTSNNVVGTWLTMVRLGVPVRDIANLMHQPIVVSYLKSLDNNDKQSITDFKLIQEHRARFGGSVNTASFDVDRLAKNVGKKEFSESDLFFQQSVFTEFLRFAKIADNVFQFTQATNYDTASFLGSAQLDKKLIKTNLEEENNIISSPYMLLDSSFVGSMADALSSASEAMAQLLIFDQPTTRNMFNRVFQFFAENKYTSADKFDKVTKKLIGSFLDFIITTKSGLNNNITQLFTNKDTSVARMLQKAKDKYPDNELLQALVMRDEGVLSTSITRNIALKANIKEAYEENRYTGLMRELRELDRELYNGLLYVALLQGQNSFSNFKNIIPIEDYSRVASQVVDLLNDPTLANDFEQGLMFYRNNWRDDNIVPKVTTDVYNSAFAGVPDNFKMWLKQNGYPTSQLIAVYRNNPVVKLLQTPQGLSIPFTSLYRIVLVNGVPLLNAKGKTIYSQINPLGDMGVAEHYEAARKTVMSNSTFQIDRELSDEEITNMLYNKPSTVARIVQEEATGSTNIGEEIEQDGDYWSVYENGYTVEATIGKDKPKEIEVVKKYSNSDVKANPNKVYVFGDNVKRTGIGGQAQIRNNFNAMGIATKLAPSMEESSFMTDKDLVKNKSIIDEDISKIKATGKIVVFPEDGLGTGLAKLKEKAPQTYNYLKQRLLQEFGFNNDNGVITKIVPTTNTSEAKTVNVFAGQGDNYVLSNFAERLFTFKGVTYTSVEQAFQETKFKYTNGTAKDREIKDKIAKSNNSSEIKKLGKEYPTLNKAKWDKESEELMREMMLNSFQQNPEAAKKLLATGSAVITHQAKGVEQDNGRFSKLLTEVRGELSKLPVDTKIDDNLTSDDFACEKPF